MQEHVVEIFSPRYGAQLIDVSEPVLAGCAPRRVVDARVVLGPEPRPVFGIEVAEREGVVGQLVADLLAPGAVPALDDALGLAVLPIGVEQANAELAADASQ